LNDAEAAYREAIALGQKTLALAPKMVDNLENPNLVYYRFSLAACYQNLGNIVRDRDNPSDGLERYDKAFGLLNPMMDRPDEATVCLRNVCWDRANAHDQLGNHVRANEDWRNAITFNGNAEPDGTQLRLFPAANQMEIKLLSQPKPSVSLFYEAAVLNAEALAAAKQADEVSLQAYYARRSLEFLKQADAAGWFQDQLKLKQFIGDKRFEALPSAALRKFVEGLDFKMKVKG
jgi:tetratricopeptide (TPR) repeat protein